MNSSAVSLLSRCGSCTMKVSQ